MPPPSVFAVLAMVIWVAWWLFMELDWLFDATLPEWIPGLILFPVWVFQRLGAADAVAKIFQSVDDILMRLPAVTDWAYGCLTFVTLSVLVAFFNHRSIRGSLISWLAPVVIPFLLMDSGAWVYAHRAVEYGTSGEPAEVSRLWERARSMALSEHRLMQIRERLASSMKSNVEDASKPNTKAGADSLPTAERPADSAAAGEISGDSRESGGTTTLPAPPELPAMAPVSLLPEDVLGYGGFSSFGSLSEAIYPAAGRFGWNVPPPRALLQIVAGMLGVQSCDWLDQERPIRIVVLSPGLASVPLILDMPTRSRETLVTAFPASADSKDGELYRYESGKTVLHVLVLEGRAVFSFSEKAILTLRPFLEGELATYAPRHVLQGAIAVGRIRSQYSAQLSAVESELLQDASPGGIPGADTTADIQRQALKHAFALIRGIERLEFGADIRDATLAVKLDGLIRPGSEGQLLISPLMGRVEVHAARLPANSYAVMAVNLPPVMLDVAGSLAFGSLARKLALDDPEALSKLWREVSSTLTGDLAGGLYLDDGGCPLGIDLFVGVNSATESRQALSALAEEALRQLGAPSVLEKAGMLDMAYKLDLSSLSGAITSVGRLGETYGFVFSTVEAAEGGTSIYGVSLQLDLDQTAAVGGEVAAGAQQMSRWLPRGRMELAIAFGKNYVEVVWGAEALARARGSAKQAAPAAVHPGFLDDDELLKERSVLLYMFPNRALEAFAKSPLPMVPEDKLHSLPQMGPMGIQLSVPAPNRIEAVLEIPLDIQAVVSASAGVQ